MSGLHERPTIKKTLALVLRKSFITTIAFANQYSGNKGSPFGDQTKNKFRDLEIILIFVLK